jgi:hypothetical protein
MLKKRSQKNIPTDGSNTRSELTFLCFVSDSRRQQKKNERRRKFKV